MSNIAARFSQPNTSWVISCMVTDIHSRQERRRNTALHSYYFRQELSVKGKLIDYVVQSNSGIISGDDNVRYQFSGADWKTEGAPVVGSMVDFEEKDGVAHAIYLVRKPFSSNGLSKRWVAAIFAFFLGAFGIHKFYLGKTGTGLVMLCVSVFGFVLLGLPTAVMAIIAFIEFILYITKSDEDFLRIYIEEKKNWL